jgi:hypothetical protein
LQKLMEEKQAAKAWDAKCSASLTHFPASWSGGTSIISNSELEKNYNTICIGLNYRKIMQISIKRKVDQMRARQVMLDDSLQTHFSLSEEIYVHTWDGASTNSYLWIGICEEAGSMKIENKSTS